MRDLALGNPLGNPLAMPRATRAEAEKDNAKSSAAFSFTDIADSIGVDTRSLEEYNPGTLTTIGSTVLPGIGIDATGIYLYAATTAYFGTRVHRITLNEPFDITSVSAVTTVFTVSPPLNTQLTYHGITQIPDASGYARINYDSNIVQIFTWNDDSHTGTGINSSTLVNTISLPSKPTNSNARLIVAPDMSSIFVQGPGGGTNITTYKITFDVPGQWQGGYNITMGTGPTIKNGGFSYDGRYWIVIGASLNSGCQFYHELDVPFDLTSLTGTSKIMMSYDTINTSITSYGGGAGILFLSDSMYLSAKSGSSTDTFTIAKAWLDGNR